MNYTAQERSYDLGWYMANAIKRKEYWFIGAYRQEIRLGRERGWFYPLHYVRGFLEVITDSGRQKRRRVMPEWLRNKTRADFIDGVMAMHDGKECVVLGFSNDDATIVHVDYGTHSAWVKAGDLLPHAKE